MTTCETKFHISDLPRAVRDEARTSVRKGAEALDLGKPTWFKRIDTRTLDLSRSCSCVLGQLYGDYDGDSISTALRRVRNRIENFLDRDIYKVAEGYGFSYGPAGSRWVANATGADAYLETQRRNKLVWQALDHYWKVEIRKRRGMDAEKVAA